MLPDFSFIDKSPPASPGKNSAAPTPNESVQQAGVAFRQTLRQQPTTSGNATSVSAPEVRQPQDPASPPVLPPDSGPRVANVGRPAATSSNEPAQPAPSSTQRQAISPAIVDDSQPVAIQPDKAISLADEPAVPVTTGPTTDKTDAADAAQIDDFAIGVAVSETFTEDLKSLQFPLSAIDDLAGSELPAGSVPSDASNVEHVAASDFQSATTDGQFDILNLNDLLGDLPSLLSFGSRTTTDQKTTVTTELPGGVAAAALPEMTGDDLAAPVVANLSSSSELNPGTISNPDLQLTSNATAEEAQNAALNDSLLTLPSLQPAVRNPASKSVRPSGKTETSATKSESAAAASTLTPTGVSTAASHPVVPASLPDAATPSPQAPTATEPAFAQTFDRASQPAAVAPVVETLTAEVRSTSATASSSTAGAAQPQQTSDAETVAKTVSDPVSVAAFESTTLPSVAASGARPLSETGRRQIARSADTVVLPTTPSGSEAATGDSHPSRQPKPVSAVSNQSPSRPVPVALAASPVSSTSPVSVAESDFEPTSVGPVINAAAVSEDSIAAPVSDQSKLLAEAAVQDSSPRATQEDVAGSAQQPSTAATGTGRRPVQSSSPPASLPLNSTPEPESPVLTATSAGTASQVTANAVSAAVVPARAVQESGSVVATTENAAASDATQNQSPASAQRIAGHPAAQIRVAVPAATGPLNQAVARVAALPQQSAFQTQPLNSLPATSTPTPSRDVSASKPDSQPDPATASAATATDGVTAAPLFGFPPPGVPNTRAGTQSATAPALNVAASPVAAAAHRAAARTVVVASAVTEAAAATATSDESATANAVLDPSSSVASSSATGIDPANQTNSDRVPGLKRHEAADTDPGTGHPTLNLERTASSIRDALDGRNPLRVQLTPPELGAMQVEISRSENGIVARLEVHTVSAHRALAERLPELHQSLAQSGIPVDRIDVTLSENQNESSQQREQSRREPAQRDQSGRDQRQSDQQRREQEAEQREQQRQRRRNSPQPVADDIPEQSRFAA